MGIADFDQTLSRFGLEKLKQLVDLTLDSNGKIAVTRDGDWQMGELRVNALFRLVGRWRISQPTIDELTRMWRVATIEAHAIEGRPDRATIMSDPTGYWRDEESLVELRENAAILAGSIFVVVSNLTERFRKDLNTPRNGAAAPSSPQQPFDALVWAAAANFRHYDEWAGLSTIERKQRQSLKVLCPYLGIPIEEPKGVPGIRDNACSDVLRKLSAESDRDLHQRLFDYAKSAACYDQL